MLSSLQHHAQYRRFDESGSLFDRSGPPSPTLAKNQSSPRCPLFLVALPLFLLMTAAPLLSAIFRNQPPPQARAHAANTVPLSTKHVVHPLSVASIPIPPPPPVDSSAPAEFTCSPDVTVHVIFSNHLDVGFRRYNPAGWFAAEVIDQALNQWIPDAISWAHNLTTFPATANPYNDTYTWTTHPWLLSLALDCPPNMGYRCPNASAVAALEQAVRDQTIAFHAFVFNAEAELYNAELFDFGIQLTHDLAVRLGKPDGLPTVISQRDVPGVTRAVIPLMHNRSVRAFSIGANPGAGPPDVPDAFLWKYDDSEDSPSIIMLYHKGGYGGIDRSEALVIDGFNHVAVYAFNGDNLGPYTAQYVVDTLSHLRSQFPNCTVKTSTFDAYVSPLWTAIQEKRVQLPVFAGIEMADTWTYGAASDPVKVAKVRALQRLRSECIADSDCDSKSYDFYNFSRLLLKAGEHTWGADVSAVLNIPDQFDANSSYYLWSNDGLQRGLERSEWQTLIETWREQRAWAVDIPLSALPAKHWMSVQARDAFAAIQPAPVDLTGWQPVGSSQGANISGHGWEMGVGSDGSVDWLRDNTNNRAYATPGVNALGRLVYEAFTEGDQDNFIREYCYEPLNDPNSWLTVDYGKRGLDRVVQPNITRHEPAILVQAYTRTTKQPGLLSFYVHTRLPEYTTVTYGGWQSAFSLIQLNTTAATVTITLTLYNKTATRIPESLAFLFSYPSPSWPTVDKLSTPINTSHIMNHGSGRLHGVGDGGVVVNGWATLRSSDVALVGIGDRVSAYPVPFELDSTPSQVYWILFANLWGTNYPTHWPFQTEDSVGTQYRFSVQLDQGSGASGAGLSSAGGEAVTQ